VYKRRQTECVRGMLGVCVVEERDMIVEWLLKNGKYRHGYQRLKQELQVRMEEQYGGNKKEERKK